MGTENINNVVTHWISVTQCLVVSFLTIQKSWIYQSLQVRLIILKINSKSLYPKKTQKKNITNVFSEPSSHHHQINDSKMAHDVGRSLQIQNTKPEDWKTNIPRKPFRIALIELLKFRIQFKTWRFETISKKLYHKALIELLNFRIQFKTGRLETISRKLFYMVLVELSKF